MIQNEEVRVRKNRSVISSTPLDQKFDIIIDDKGAVKLIQQKTKLD